MISINNIEKPFVFQCAILVANVADSYQITLFARRHCFLLRAPKEASRIAKIASLASGAPLGPRAASWRPSWDFSGRKGGPGSSLKVLFGYIWALFGLIFKLAGTLLSDTF